MNLSFEPVLTGPSLEVEIREALERLRVLAESLGIRGSAFSSADLSRRLKSPALEGSRVLISARSLESTMRLEQAWDFDTLSKDYELACLNRALWTTGYRCRFDLDSYISEGDVIEIYNADFMQLYRNLTFFDLTGYTFLDLLENEFHRLYSRPEFVTLKVMQQVQQVLSTEMPLKCSIPIHEMVEVLSPEQRCFLTEYRYIIPLHDRDGACTAIISTIRPNPTDERARS